MSWQAAGPGPGGGMDDPFSAVEQDVPAMAAQHWWRAAAPQQRAEAITSRMLFRHGEWWLFGAWARWYRCGLDGSWQPSPPPADPRSRREAAPAPRGAGNPPVPPQLFPTGPDLQAGRIASTGFLGDMPDQAAVGRLGQVQISALAVNPQQFAMQDQTFQPGTPSTLAAAWGALLWCAGSPVVLDTHPMIELFVPYLTTPSQQLRWMMPPDFSTLVGYYASRLGAGDWSGAQAIARVMHDVAAALQSDPRFRPGADALAAITATSLRMVQHDMATVRYGGAAVLQEWRRRCPAEYALPMVRDAAPGEFLRLGLYDLQQIVATLYGQPLDHTQVRRAGVSVLAADLHAAPQAVQAVLQWLDPDSARTLQTVLHDPGHELRAFWPRDGMLPEALRNGRPRDLEALLATSYTLGLTWCRIAQTPPPATGFGVAAAAADALTRAASQEPPSTGELTPWQIIEAARAHMAAERAAEPAPQRREEPPHEQTHLAQYEQQPHEPPSYEPPSYEQAQQPHEPPPSYAPPSYEQPPRHAAQYPPEDPGFPRIPPPPAPSLQAPEPYAAPGGRVPYSPAPYVTPEPYAADPPAAASPAAFAQEAPPAPPAAPMQAPPDWPPAAPGYGPPPAETTPSFSPPPPAPAHAPVPPAPPPTPRPAPAPEPAAQIAEAYGIRFLCGPDDAERLITEVRRRGKWAQRLRGQEVSSASMPALLLIGAGSTGQRRLGRMVARALADVQVSSGELRSVHFEELRERGPDGAGAALDEHSGHALLLEGLDALILDDAQGTAYATALYRARAEGVSDTALLATCEPDRISELTAAAPELVTDFRAVRMPDLSDPDLRVALLALLAEERQLRISGDAWAIVGRDLGVLRGRGRLTNARLIEAYLDRACTRHLSGAVETQALGGTAALVLTPADFEGVVAGLSLS